MGDTKVFGVSIQDLAKRSKDPNGCIPSVVKQTIAYLDLQGLEVEGIFRKNGSASMIQYYKDQFDQGVLINANHSCSPGAEVDLTKCTDTHTVCGLLTLWLRELPEPLLTYDLYEKFIETQAAGNSG